MITNDSAEGRGCTRYRERRETKKRETELIHEDKVAGTNWLFPQSVPERWRERERETDTQIYRGVHKETETDIFRQTHIDKDTWTGERDRQRYRQTHTKKQTQRQTCGQRDT